MDQLLNKCGYVVSYMVNLKESITLSSSEDTIIRMEYRSRVSDNDNSMSFRVAVPCRRYILNFIAPENYKVIAHAFGSFYVAANSLIVNTIIQFQLNLIIGYYQKMVQQFVALIRN